MGILGPGGIATTFAAALQYGTRQRIVAAGSRSLARAEEFGRRFGCRAHASYEALVADPEIDVVYVATPHSAHHAHALLAIAAGKHVLVEKAFTRNAAEAREVIAAADAAGVFCMEAMWSRFLPHYDVIGQAVADGLLGPVQSVAADHGQVLYPDGPERLASPELSGGALLDLGVYPLSFAAMLLPEIEEIRAVGTVTPSGVDARECVALKAAGGAVATCTASMTSRTQNTALVAGDRARLEIDARFYQPTAVRLCQNTGGVVDVFEPDQRRHGLHFEAAEVARCVSEGRQESPRLPLAETVRVMEIMDEVRRQLAMTYPGEGAPYRGE